MFVIYFLVSYLCVAVLYLHKGVNHVSKDVKATLKCLPLLLLIAWFVYQWKYPVDGSRRCDTQNESTFILTLLALVSSVIGDAFLVGHFKLGFLLGVIAFAAAQVLYSIILSTFFFSVVTVKMIGLSALLVVLVDFSVVWFVYSRLKTLLERIDKYHRLLTCLILVYFLLISVMLGSSLCLFIAFYNVAAFFGLVGGTLFYVSDLSITLSAIYEAIIFKRRILVMSTYYASQFFIALCILSLCTCPV